MTRGHGRGSAEFAKRHGGQLVELTVGFSACGVGFLGEGTGSRIVCFDTAILVT